MPRRPKRERVGKGTLGWLSDLCASKGADEARAAFSGIAREAAVQPYRVFKTGHGQPSYRTDVDRSDRITYEAFGPPSLWDPPYWVARVRFEEEPKRDFMCHAGEELLIPISGAIHYHFFWGANRQNPACVVTDPPFEAPSLVRINPYIPHHTWSGGPGAAEAWMIFRPLTNTPAAVGTLAKPETTPVGKPHRFSVKQLKDPARYALLAWGIAERIRLKRLNSRLTITEVAALCDVDPSLVSRAETADANISIESLIRLCRVLGIPIGDLIAPESWTFEEVLLSPTTAKQPTLTLLLQSRPQHFLHPLYHELPAQQSQTIPTALAYTTELSFGTWIILEGEVIFTLPEELGGTSEIIETGGVIHFRHIVPARLTALKDSRILYCLYSPICPTQIVGQTTSTKSPKTRLKPRTVSGRK